MPSLEEPISPAPGAGARTSIESTTSESGVAPSKPPLTPATTEKHKQVLGLPIQDALTALHDATHFGICELESIWEQFSRRVVVGKRIDKATFMEEMGHAFGMADPDLLEHIFYACDETGDGTINFRHFVSCLSTIYRGNRDEIMDFWFRMYDTDRDGMLTLQEFEDMLNDVPSHVLAAKLAKQVEELGCFSGGTPENGLTYDDFQMLMDEEQVLPQFATPHQSAQSAQIEAYRDLAPPEREVLALLGKEVRLRLGEKLVTEGKASNYFYFVLEGEVKLLRNNIVLKVDGPGSFVGEAALFNDVKSVQKDGRVRFTTTASAASEQVVVVRMDIRDFYPLVLHEHLGAVAIMQRLGAAIMHRLNQMEDNLQHLLNTQDPTENTRMSRSDWDNIRKKLLHIWALRYHRIGRKGKLEISATKSVGDAAALSIAYSPGVAEPCVAIKADPAKVYDYTAKGHLVGVVTNGTAVLGLGNIGPLAAKPVMEGKAVLFKKFADIDAFDIELKQADPQKLVDTIVALEPTFGGINLEDIKAPECFFVEKECQRLMNIPVFHDDQHGTAIIAGAGLVNALELVNKNIEEVRVVVCGCGAAGFTVAIHFVVLGVKPENMICCDIQGVVYKGREDLTEENYLSRVAVDTPLRTLTEAVSGADVFVGLSAGGLLKPDMLRSMARDPLVFALANPVPEIDPNLAHEVRPDVIMATGRSDFPNQINNVCAFPYMFRGALDCRAACINEEMKLAATRAIAELAKEPRSTSEGCPSLSPRRLHQRRKSDGSEKDLAALAKGGLPSHTSLTRLTRHDSRANNSSYGDMSSMGGDESEDLTFGPTYIIPKPFDDRLLVRVSTAVAAAAIDSGVSTIPLDLVSYASSLKDMYVMKQGPDGGR